MRAKEATITAVDFESTGSVDGFADEPWQIGMVFLEKGVVVPESRFESLLCIGHRPFNPYAPGNHRQRREEIAKAPSMREIWPQIQPWLVGRPVVAHNIGTERRFITHAAPMHKIGPWIDSLKLARFAYPRLSSYALEDLLDVLGLVGRVEELCAGLAPHDALYDAAACGVLLEYFLGLPGWEDVSIEGLAGVTPTAYYRNAVGLSV